MSRASVLPGDMVAPALCRRAGIVCLGQGRTCCCPRSANSASGAESQALWRFAADINRKIAARH